MRSTIQVTTPPSLEPVTIPEVKSHTRIDTDADDTLIAGYITAARRMAEGYLGRALLPQTLTWVVRPTGDLHKDRVRIGRSPMYIPRAPVTAISSVTILDLYGNSTTVAAATLPVVPPTPLIGYVADLSLEPALLRFGSDTPLAGGQTLGYTAIENLQVQFTAGYADASKVPANIKNAIMQMVAYLYENRGDVFEEMPKTFEWLLDLDRLVFLGN